MMSVATGHDAGYLTGCVGTGAESYYLDAITDGEPAGIFSQVGGEALGLTGEVDPDVMAAVYGEMLDPRDPRFADPESRAECTRLGRAPQQARDVETVLAERIAKLPSAPLPEEVHRMRTDIERTSGSGAVPYLDLTYSPQKSVTVLHTAFHRAELDALRNGDQAEAAMWAERRMAVETAIWAGNKAMLDHAHAEAGYSRAGASSTATRWVPDRGWTVASFFQHTSRDLDPQLHVHNAVLNRVVCEDGKVRTLDSRAVHSIKQGAGTIADRTMEESLTRSLGVKWQMRADGVGREIVGVDQAAMDLFSSRSKTLNAKAAALVQQAEERQGRALTSIEVDRIRRAASMATRKGKTHDGESTETMLDRWDAELRGELAGGLGRIAERFRENGAPVAAGEWSPEAVMSQAVAACQETRSAWSRSELIRQTLLALPDHLGGLDGEQVTDLASRLADQALESGGVVRVSGDDLDVVVPESLRGPNGRSVYAPPTGAKYAAAGHILAEEALRRSAIVRDRTAAPVAAVDAWLAEHGESLGPDQAAAVRGITTSGAALTVLVGPAGTGKSHTAGAINAAWVDATGGRVIGLATSQIATEVLRDDATKALQDAGVALALNTTAFLNAQNRLTAGSTSQHDLQWRLSPNDLVLVDEASMVSTADLTGIRVAADVAGARVVWTGDPAQLGAVDAGGMMAFLADGKAETYSLAEVRRFAEPWERAASLKLRDGDQGAITEYDRHGRILDCGTREDAAAAAGRAYVADRVAGHSSIVITTSNEEAGALSAQIRDRLVELGHVEADGVILGRDGCTAGVGDLVAARRNDYLIGVTNRAQYVVESVNEDGGLTIRPADGGPSRVLPPHYVAEHTALAYAGTIHSAQGLTVDRSHLVADEMTGREAAYVGLTRGRDGNWAYVSTTAVDKDGLKGDPRTAAAVLADSIDRAADDSSAALAQAEQSNEALRSEALIFGRIEDAVQVSTRARTDRMLDDLTTEGALSEDDRARLGADQGTEYLSRVLRRAEQAGLDPTQVLRTAVTDPRPLAEANSPAQMLSARITSTTDLTPDADHASAVPAGLPADMGAYVGDLRELADDRRRDLGSQVAEQAPPWALDAFGPVPEDVIGRADWEHKAGIVAAHREASGWTDETVPIGRGPAVSRTEHRAAWHDAWTAVGRPEAHIEEADLTDGALRVRVAAWERQLADAPEYVDQELKISAQAAARAEQDTHLAAAAGDDAEAADAAADAEVARITAQGLSEAAEARDAWLAHHLATREAHDRARDEMTRRGLPPAGHEPDRTTAEDWLAAERAARVDDDDHRVITEADLIDEGTEAVTDDTETVHGTLSEPSPLKAGQPAAQDRIIPPERAVPLTETETQALVIRARVAVDRIADQKSQEAAHREAEATAQASDDHDAHEHGHRRRTASAAASIADHASINPS